MSRRAVAAALASGLPAALAAWLAVAGCSGEPPPPPDVILVLADTLRVDRTSLGPGPDGATPALTAWSAAGTRYSQAVAPSS